MSDSTPVEPVQTPAPAEMPMGREYIRRMNEAEKTGVTLDAPPQVEPEKPADEAPPTDPKPDEAERDAKGKFKGKPRHDPIARMTEATAEAARVKAENADLRRQLEARQTPPEPQRQPEPAPVPVGAPKLDDFLTEPDPYAALATATARFEVTRILAAERLAAHAEQVNKANADRFAAAIEDDDELPALMEAADTALVQAGADPRAPFPGVMLDAIKASNHGPAIARFLGSHPKELVQWAREVSQLPPSAATVVRLMLEAQVKATNPVPTAAIPTGSAAALPRPSAVPISPVRTSREPAPERDPSELAFGRDYVRKMNERERKGA